MSRKRKAIATPSSRSSFSAETHADADAPQSPSLSIRLRVPILIGIVVFCLGGVWWGIPAWRLREAEKAIASRQFDLAKSQLLAYPSWGTELGKSQFLLARVDRYQGGFMRAQSYLSKARAVGFDSEAIQREAALLKIENGLQTPGLMARQDAFLAADPADRPAVYEVYATAKLVIGDIEGALDLLDRWSQEYPRDARPFYHFGILWQTQGRDDEAIAMFRESTQRDPRLVDSYVSQALIWHERGNFRQVLQAYQVAFEAAPDNVAVRCSLGRSLWKMRRQSEAIQILEPLSREHPTLFPVGRLVAQYHSLQNEPSRVLSILEPMAQHFPDDVSLNYMLGCAYKSLGRIKESENAMTKFIVANEQLDVMRYAGFNAPPEQRYEESIRLAKAYRKYDWPRALKWLKLARESSPLNPFPHQLLADYYREGGSFKESLRMENAVETLSN